MTKDGGRRGCEELVEVSATLTPEQAQALLHLCDAVALRGPEAKMLVAGAQAALMEALRKGQGRGGWPSAPTASDDPGCSSSGLE